MTMHGSKGLEFRAVHLTGVTKGTMPLGPQAPACPAPDGMIGDAVGVGWEITDREHNEERQCLFYVALSRARDRLILYSPNKRADGAARNPSAFVDRLGSTILRRSVRARTDVIAAMEPAVSIVFSGEPAFPQTHLSLYERCPRRFFYTYILRLGGRRTTTAYEDMHEIVRGAMAELADGPAKIDAAALAGVIDRHWKNSRLADSEAAAAYRPLVEELAVRFAQARAEQETKAGRRLSFSLGGVRITVEFDYARRTASGGWSLRQVHTGHHQKTVVSKSASIMAPLFATQEEAPDHSAELLYLSDAIVVPLAGLDKRMNDRRDRLAAIVRSILAGDFPAAPSIRSCPKCPAFYTCSPVPSGSMRKKF